jgi:hypothetical protein
MPLHKTGTFACSLRDRIARVWIAKENLSHDEVIDRLAQIDIDEQFYGDILDMASHNRLLRDPDIVEDILEAYVKARIYEDFFNEHVCGKLATGVFVSRRRLN